VLQCPAMLQADRKYTLFGNHDKENNIAVMYKQFIFVMKNFFILFAARVYVS
jgi:hypothetical protein